MLEDVQARPDTRGVALEEVGIKGLRYPVLVADGQGAKRETVATAVLSVSLAPDVKGAHLSRFVEVLHGSRDQLTLESALRLADDLRHRMGSPSAQIHFTFPYFLEREAPVTRAPAYVEYTCGLSASSDPRGAEVTLTVDVPVTSVCPCSKAISDRGAHNQRGHISIEVKPSSLETDLWFDELIEIAETAASSPVYALLKRPDERYVTMAGYDNPVFVEDMARNVCLVLDTSSRVAAYRLQVVNDESIHNHAAYAAVSWKSSKGA
ncbi:GTP cyclohydrolase FolE2 [Sphaerimonospora thailandensis]|uniref:GTP cyclohydrolase FolE2 n=1 Tax=Sphaerimonospora thailandensis TaxID=795644 RepID=A0A8J3RDT6_9ACTN|nr:GTP cyclohydrolase FolE2 [Sphaerimonospora thailandensis]GIH72012.1 GTP cyclohydrolase FolE2 [Sphaerimonospora thailandensis]